MALKAAMWVHGTGVEPERPGPWLNITRPAWGTDIKTAGGDQWFHFQFSEPVILDDHRLKLQKIFLMCQTMNNAKVAAVHVWDGRDKIFAADNLALTGDHSRTLDALNTWVVNPPIDVKYGLDMAVLVSFPSDGQNIPEVLFTSAGADFTQ